MKIQRWIFLVIVYLGELVLVLFLVGLAVNLRGVLSPPDAGAVQSPAAAPTLRAPARLPAGTPKAEGPGQANSGTVAKNVPVNLDNKFQITYVGEFRDPILFAPSQADWKHAQGIYATIQFRIKNLQPVSDSLAAHYDLVAITEDGKTISSDPAAEGNAVWLYCQCDTDRKMIPPGGESVFVIVFDVPVSTQRLTLALTRGTIFDVLNGAPRFSVVNFDKVSPWQPH